MEADHGMLCHTLMPIMKCMHCKVFLRFLKSALCFPVFKPRFKDSPVRILGAEDTVPRLLRQMQVWENTVNDGGWICWP